MNGCWCESSWSLECKPRLEFSSTHLAKSLSSSTQSSSSSQDCECTKLRVSIAQAKSQCQGQVDENNWITKKGFISNRTRTNSEGWHDAWMVTVMHWSLIGLFTRSVAAAPTLEALFIGHCLIGRQHDAHRQGGKRWLQRCRQWSWRRLSWSTERVVYIGAYI